MIQAPARYNPHAPDWHKATDIPPDITLEEYAAAWIDMEPHIGQLRDFASRAKTIVEFGLRGGVSTWAMLDGLPSDGRLIGVDIDPLAPIPPRVFEDSRFRWVRGDAVSDETYRNLSNLNAHHADLVMIDSSHEFTQTVLELVRAAEMRPDVILLHDYRYAMTPGVSWAVDGFVAEPYLPENMPPYRLDRVYESRWGLAVLVPR